MKNHKTNLVISGATGFLGNYLIKQLESTISDNNLVIYALGRNEIKLKMLESSTVKVLKFVIGDNLSWLNELEGKVYFLDLAYLTNGNLSENYRSLKVHFKQLNSMVKRNNLNLIYTSTIGLYGPNMDPSNLNKRRHGYATFRTYEYFKFLSEKWVANNQNTCIWRLGHIMGPGSNYMKAVVSNRFDMPVSKEHFPNVCLSRSVYNELTRVLSGDVLREVTFTETNNLMTNEEWQKLLSRELGIVYSEKISVKPMSIYKGYYPLFLEMFSLMNTYLPNKLNIWMFDKLFKRFKAKSISVNHLIDLDTPSPIVSEYVLNERELFDALEECKDWYHETLKV